MTIATEITKIMKEMIESDPRFQAGCHFCGAKRAKGMTFHHFGYRKDDVVYSDFPQNQSGRLAYLKALKPHVLARPQRFALLCGKHHYAAENAVRYGDELWKKLGHFRIHHRRMAAIVSRKSKRCSRCKQSKDVECFYRTISMPDGRGYVCIECLGKARVRNATKRKKKIVRDCKRIMGACGGKNSRALGGRDTPQKTSE